MAAKQFLTMFFLAIVALVGPTFGVASGDDDSRLGPRRIAASHAISFWTSEVPEWLVRFADGSPAREQIVRLLRHRAERRLQREVEPERAIAAFSHDLELALRMLDADRYVGDAIVVVDSNDGQTDWRFAARVHGDTEFWGDSIGALQRVLETLELLTGFESPPNVPPSNESMSEWAMRLDDDLLLIAGRAEALEPWKNELAQVSSSLADSVPFRLIFGDGGVSVPSDSTSIHFFVAPEEIPALVAVGRYRIALISLFPEAGFDQSGGIGFESFRGVGGSFWENALDEAVEAESVETETLAIEGGVDAIWLMTQPPSGLLGVLGNRDEFDFALPLDGAVPSRVAMLALDGERLVEVLDRLAAVDADWSTRFLNRDQVIDRHEMAAEILDDRELLRRLRGMATIDGEFAFRVVDSEDSEAAQSAIDRLIERWGRRMLATVGVLSDDAWSSADIEVRSSGPSGRYALSPGVLDRWRQAQADRFADLRAQNQRRLDEALEAHGPDHPQATTARRNLEVIDRIFPQIESWVKWLSETEWVRHESWVAMHFGAVERPNDGIGEERLTRLQEWVEELRSERRNETPIAFEASWVSPPSTSREASVEPTSILLITGHRRGLRIDGRSTVRIDLRSRDEPLPPSDR